MENRSLAFQTFGFLTAALAIIAGLLVGSEVDTRWFGLYGGPATLLAALPFLQFMLWTRLRAKGRRPWQSLLVTAPLGIAALAHIVFWVAFFNDPGMAVNLGVVRGAIWAAAEPYQHWIVATYLVVSGYVLSRAV